MTTCDLPSYPASREITLECREFLQSRFQELEAQSSELSFANIYLFRKVHDYRLTNLSGSIVILGKGYDGQPYFISPLDGDRGKTAKKLLDEGLTLYADESFVETELSGYDYEINPDRDSDDYLYLRSDLVDLPGRRFHKKKNRISYFSARHDYTVEPYGERHQRGAEKLLDDWLRVNGESAGGSLTAEVEATREGLEKSDQLGLTGVVLLVEGAVAAFALGESLSSSTFVCHFEKSDPFIEGAAQLVNREMARFIPENFNFINREQDLGDPGLRSAKLSYHPVEMVRKYRIRRTALSPSAAVQAP